MIELGDACLNWRGGAYGTIVSPSSDQREGIDAKLAPSPFFRIIEG